MGLGESIGRGMREFKDSVTGSATDDEEGAIPGGGIG